MVNRRGDGLVVGPENGGMACMFTMMNNARLHVGLQGVGVAEAATQHALAYAQNASRAASQVPKGIIMLCHHKPPRCPAHAADHALTDAARAICYENGVMADLAYATGDAEAKAKNDLLTPISKAFGTDIANEVAPLAFKSMEAWALSKKPAPQVLRDRICPFTKALMAFKRLIWSVASWVMAMPSRPILMK